MRYSSMKSVVVTVVITVTLVAAVPTANARPAQSTRDSQSSRMREDAPIAERIAAVRQFISRTLRRLTSNTGLTVPTPKQLVEEEAPTP